MPLELNGTTGVQGNSGAFVAATAVASTSGTSIDFTGIPSWVKRITFTFNGVSTNGGANILIRFGTSGGVATTGYDSNGLLVSVAAVQSTSGFIFYGGSSANIFTGSLIFNLQTGNTWVGTGTLTMLQSGTYYTNLTTGSVVLGAVLDRVRITTTSTDTFDAGTINILYE
jgi:hypothetical protein